MNFKNEEAVSPVIGVILMVAITVILAAVIAAFVFGMAGSVETNKNVAATAQLQGENVVVTYQGGADNNQVEWLRIYVDNGTPTKATMYVYNTTNGTTTITETKPTTDNLGDGAPEVGAKVALPATPGKTLVTVAAHFRDDKEQVILDRNL